MGRLGLIRPLVGGACEATRCNHLPCNGLRPSLRNIPSDTHQFPLMPEHESLHIMHMLTLTSRTPSRTLACPAHARPCRLRLRARIARTPGFYPAPPRPCVTHTREDPPRATPAHARLCGWNEPPPHQHHLMFIFSPHAGNENRVVDLTPLDSWTILECRPERRKPLRSARRE